LIVPDVAQAHGGDDAEARRYFSEGNRAYQDGRYVDALASYREAYRLAPRPRVLYNLGRCEERLGNLESAYGHYERFLREGKPDPTTRAAVEATLDELRSRLEIAVAVRSVPAGAQVFVDGGAQPVARTPAEVKLHLGPHRLRVVKEGATAKEVSIDVRPGATAPVEVEFDAIASIDIATDPPDAEIRPERGDSVASRGSYRAELPPGRYSFTVRRAGYEDAHVEIKAAAGETTRQLVTLRKSPEVGLLSVRSNVFGAAVSVDGLPRGLTRATEESLRIELAAGRHQVVVEHTGNVSWTNMVDVVSGRETTVDVRLAAGRSRAARVGAWTLGGVGAGAIVAGSIFGVIAIGDYGDLKMSRTKDAADRKDAHALTADILLGTGAVALIGSYLLFAPASSETGM
jgi:PEGA domain